MEQILKSESEHTQSVINSNAEFLRESIKYFLTENLLKWQY